MTNTITVETRAQTIYYEDTNANIKRYYFTENDRLTQSKAEKLLLNDDINVSKVLRVLTEKVTISIEREYFEKSVIDSEKFYAQSKNKKLKG